MISDLGAVFDEHVRSEFELRDVDATMATMTDAPYVNHVPTLAGGVGSDGVREFYATYFIGRWPADTNVVPVSRTVGMDRVVDEFIVTFTHDIEMPTLLPGIGPTGRHVELPHVVVMQFDGDKVAHEHIYWDQGTLLVQIGILDPATLPVVGIEQARKVLDPSYESNLLIRRSQGL